MHVFLDIGSGEGPRLIDATDFEAFKVVIAGGHDVESARRALTPVAELLDEGDAMVDAGGLTLLAGELARRFDLPDPLADGPVTAAASPDGPPPDAALLIEA